MPWIKVSNCLIVVALCSASFPCRAADTAGAPATLRAQFADLAAKAEAQQRAAVVGKEGWLFLTAELRHLGLGPFWGKDAKAVSRAANSDAADPLPAILDFNAQLKRAGIELILLPVPPKAALYAEKVLDQAPPPEGKPRADEATAEFARLCTEQGIKVLDPGPAFRRARDAETTPLYCRTDSHWSGRGCVVAAELLSKDVRTRPWFASVPKRTWKGEWREAEIRGDLVDLVETQPASEKIRLRFVIDGGGAAPADWRESPVLLLGDSHTLVFHAGEDLHGTGAGLADQLALELGFPVDVVGVRGSGATPARINLLRRKDNLAGKKLVIWCFSAREFTEATGGWRLVPVLSK